MTDKEKAQTLGVQIATLVNSTTMSYLMSGDSPAESIYKCENCGGTVSEETYSFCPWCGKRIVDYTYQKEK